MDFGARAEAGRAREMKTVIRELWDRLDRGERPDNGEQLRSV